MATSPQVLATFLLAALAGLAGGAAVAAPAITTHQSGSSSVKVNGATVADQSDSQTDGHVSTVAIYGTRSTPEVRTAARSAVNGELAANVRMDDKQRFSFTQVNETISAATLEIHAAADNALLRRASLDFILPASFMEVTSNLELPHNALEMVLLADLRVCFADLCSSSDSHFSFQAILSATWQSFSNNVQANGDASLDLSPLRNPTLTQHDAPDAFFRTVTVDFAAFHGHLDLGLIPTTAPLTVEYQMQARGSGRLAANIGLAGINDPFVLDTDPVQAGALVLTLEPAQAVPEPQAWVLLVGGFALTAGLARRRRAMQL
jgi:hypothetical protein